MVKAATLATHAHTPVLAKRTGSEKCVIEPIDDGAGCTSLYVAGRIAAVISNMLFRNLVTNLSNKPLHLPKHMIVVNVTDSSPKFYSDQGCFAGN